MVPCGNGRDFGMGVFACPIDTSPSARVRKLDRTSMRKLKRGFRKPRNPFIILFRSGDGSLENSYAKILALKINFAHTPV